MSDDLICDQVASLVIYELKECGNFSLQLYTFGPHLTASSKQLTADKAIAMQIGAGLSDRQLLKVLKALNYKFGRKIVESKVWPIVVERKT